MGQSQPTSEQIHQLLPLLKHYSPSAEGPYLIHNQNNTKARVKAFEFKQNKSLVDNYFRARLTLQNHPQVFEVYEYNILPSKKTNET